VEGLNERGSVATRRRVASAVRLTDGELHVLRAARAALLLLASGLLALELALGALAVGGLDALVVALELLADRAALGLGGGAGGVALSGRADSLALGAVFLLAVVLGAADRANRAFAVNDALGTSGLFASHLALGARAHRVAHGRALRVIALPAALRVALFSNSRSGQDSNNHKNEFAHF
jgi:hypothetical protein